MNTESPAHQSLKEALRSCRNKQGRPKLTWIRMIKKDLNDIDIYPQHNFENIINLAKNIKMWRAKLKQSAERPESVGVATIVNSTVQK